MNTFSITTRSLHTHTPSTANSINRWCFTLLLIMTFGFIGNSVYGQNQIYFSENWTEDGGEIPMFYKNATTTDASENVYMVGSTVNQNGDYDILVQKFDPDGGLYWEQTYNGAAQGDDMAAAVFVDNNQNVFVTGYSEEVQGQEEDLLVLKYKTNGQLEWKYHYNNGGNPTPRDIGTAITGDNNGSIFVTGSSFGMNINTLSDYVTIHLEGLNGSEVWVSRYDYTQLNDVPAKIVVSGTDVFVSGASQITTNKWEIATVMYDKSNGNQIVERRSQGNATSGVDEVYDLTLDDNGNIFLTGAVVNQNTGYDISLYKLDPQLNILWEAQYDAYGNDDRGKGIKVDNQGNVYVAGFVSNPNQGKNYNLLKYNSSGTLQWSREYNGEANLDDEAVQLTIDNTQNIFITGTVRNSVDASIQTLGYKPNGELFTQAVFENQNGLVAHPTDITIDLSGNIIVAGNHESSNGNKKNLTLKYSLIEKPYNPVMVNGKPSHNAKEILIRFDRSATNYAAIDRKGFIAGRLSDFVKPSVITAMNKKLKIDATRLSTFKIFSNLTTADSLSITRLGDTIKIDDFWATLSVFMPEIIDAEDVIDSLKSLNHIIHYSDLNHIGEFLGTPNDPLYSLFYPNGQTGLNDTVHGINVDGAWTKQTGFDLVKVGVFDTGIQWRHEEFGDGTWNGSKVDGGWDYRTGGNGTNPKDQTHPDYMGHGTAIAGIIGALRNNGKGVAGIAGGDLDSTGNKGVSLYSFGTVPSAAMVARAINDGAISNPTNGISYPINIANCSFGIGFSNKVMRNAFRNAYINGVIVSAGAGNDGDSGKMYPASFNDEWVLKVGASDSTGTRADLSNYNHDLDFIAPGKRDLFATLDHDDNMGYSYQDDGTSYSAPHVSGVAALMYSQHHPLRDTLYPNVLSPEDVDEILKRTATPVIKDIPKDTFSLSVPNQYAGYGRINAGAAINSVSLPYRVRHITHEVNTVTATLFATDQVMSYPDGYPYIDFATPQTAGWTADTVDIYKLTVNVSHQSSDPFYPLIPYIPPTESFVDGWIRNSVCEIYGLTDTIYNLQWAGATLDNIDINGATITGYLYKAKVYDNNSNFVTDSWYPTTLGSKVKLGYTIYTIDDNPNVGIEEEELLLKVNLFPNPAMNELNFSFDANNDDVQLDVYDISGRKISSYNYFVTGNESFNGTIDISSYTNGLYLCKFAIGNKQVTRKFIKQ